MALLINNITLENTGLVINNAYLHISSFMWDKANPTKLTVVFGLWVDAAAYNQGKQPLYVQAKDVSLATYLGLFASVRDSIYSHIQNSDVLYENSTVVD